MRKAVITCVACILLSAVMAGSRPAGSGDLQIVRAGVVETGQEEKAVYVYVDKKTEMRTFHHYLVYCLLKNTGTEKITVFTDFSGIKGGSLSPTIGKGGDGKPGTILLSGPSKRHYKGDPIIPCAAKLGLVDLQPGELAQIRFETSKLTRLRSVVIKYAAHHHWDGRFGNCVGRAVSEPIEVQVKRND